MTKRKRLEIEGDIEFLVVNITKDLLCNDNFNMADIFDDEFESMKIKQKKKYLKRMRIRLLANSYIGDDRAPDYSVGY
jgi:hypothetical protein